MEKYVYRRSDRHLPPASLIVFAALLCGFALVNLFWPKRENSELENRKLAQMPVFSVKTLLNGKWQDDFSTYLQDQVALRDGWINLESAVNALAFGKTEESGILNGKDGWMFTKLFTVSTDTEKQLGKNISAVTNFAQRYPGRVTFLLALNGDATFTLDIHRVEKLRLHVTLIDRIRQLENAVRNRRLTVIDMRDDYRANKDQYLYFKTDHHWTPDGAYRAYQQFCTLKNLTPFDCNVYTKITVPDFYGTHYSATRRWNAQADSFSYYDLPNQMTVYKVNGEADYEPVKTEGLMNLAKLDTRDKYGAFLDGNNGYSVIEGNGTGSILVVKDSYANSFIPYLTANYAKIGVVDFRGLAYGLDSTIEKEGYDQILILYNFQTFISDNKVIYLDRPTTLK